jgi:hypothetical protein
MVAASDGLLDSCAPVLLKEAAEAIENRAEGMLPGKGLPLT